MTHFPQPILILISLLIPFSLVFTKRWHWTAAWIGIIATIDIFDSQKYMNLTALKVSGLLFFPFILFNSKALWRSLSFRLIAYMIFYLTVVGFIFGHLFPWIDPTNLKTGRDLPQWRSVIHLGSMALEYTVAIFLALCLNRDSRSLKYLAYGIIFSVFATIVGGLIERNFHVDIYRYFSAATHLYQEIIPGRPRGLNYEPRGLAQSCIYGALLLLVCFKKNWLVATGASIMIMGATMVTYSTSATVLLIIGMLSLLFLAISDELVRKQSNSSLSGTLVGGLIVISVLCLSFFSNKDLSNHVSGDNLLSLNGNLVNKLEIFDSSSVHFLGENPVYILFGTGPGLISIPATEYIPDIYGQWKRTGFSALPHMGAVLLIANGGLILLALWFRLVIYCSIQLNKIKDMSSRPVSNTLFIFIIMMFLYLVQIHELFYVYLGIGLSATLSSNYSQSKN